MAGAAPGRNLCPHGVSKARHVVRRPLHRHRHPGRMSRPCLWAGLGYGQYLSPFDGTCHRRRSARVSVIGPRPILAHPGRRQTCSRDRPYRNAHGAFLLATGSHAHQRVRTLLSAVGPGMGSRTHRACPWKSHRTHRRERHHRRRRRSLVSRFIQLDRRPPMGSLLCRHCDRIRPHHCDRALHRLASDITPCSSADDGIVCAPWKSPQAFFGWSSRCRSSLST